MNDSRARRYAEAMGTPLPQPTGKGIRRIEAVMALVDAEINQVQDEAEGWAKSSGEAFSAWHEALARAEKAEGEVERLAEVVSRMDAEVAEQISARVDAEAEVERLRTYVEREGEKVAQLRDEWLQSAEALVRKVARVEALCKSADQRLDEPRLWTSEIRAALADQEPEHIDDSDICEDCNTRHAGACS